MKGDAVMSMLMRKVNILSRCQSQYKADRLRAGGLNPWHYNYVIPICRHPGQSQEQLARRVCIDKSNVTRHLARLEELGYVERRVSGADRRVTLVYPTEKLTDLLPEVRRVNQEWNDYILEGLEPGEAERFEATLLKITRRAQEYVNSKDEIEE